MALSCWLLTERRSVVAPQEVNPSLQPAAQILTSSPQPSGPQAHQEVQLPREMPPYIILKETAARGHGCTPIPLTATCCQIAWQ